MEAEARRARAQDQKADRNHTDDIGDRQPETGLLDAAPRDHPCYERRDENAPEREARRGDGDREATAAVEPACDEGRPGHHAGTGEANSEHRVRQIDRRQPLRPSQQ